MGCSLFERYASDTTFNKATVQTSLARLKYSGQKMDEYVAEFEGLSAKLEAMGASMDEGMLITMFFESFGYRKDSPYGPAIAALLTKDDLAWEIASAGCCRSINQ